MMPTGAFNGHSLWVISKVFQPATTLVYTSGLKQGCVTFGIWRDVTFSENLFQRHREALVTDVQSLRASSHLKSKRSCVIDCTFSCPPVLWRHQCVLQCSSVKLLHNLWRVDIMEKFLYHKSTRLSSRDSHIVTPFVLTSLIQTLCYQTVNFFQPSRE